MAVKEKILVVDDEPSIRKYLQTLLEVEGFEVETLSTGSEAIEKISKGGRPDFIILDVLMPELSGIDTLKQLLQIDRSLNVIMLSCSNEVGVVVELAGQMRIVDVFDPDGNRVQLAQPIGD